MLHPVLWIALGLSTLIWLLPRAAAMTLAVALAAALAAVLIWPALDPHLAVGLIRQLDPALSDGQALAEVALPLMPGALVMLDAVPLMAETGDWVFASGAPRQIAGVSVLVSDRLAAFPLPGDLARLAAWAETIRLHPHIWLAVGAALILLAPLTIRLAGALGVAAVSAAAVWHGMHALAAAGAISGAAATALLAAQAGLGMGLALGIRLAGDWPWNLPGRLAAVGLTAVLLPTQVQVMTEVIALPPLAVPVAAAAALLIPSLAIALGVALALAQGLDLGPQTLAPLTLAALGTIEGLSLLIRPARPGIPLQDDPDSVPA